jgi:hypothetical protein
MAADWVSDTVNSTHPLYEDSMRNVFSIAMLIVAILWVAGCKSGTAGQVVTVTVQPTGVNVVVGTTLQFTATVTGTSNTGVTWSVAGGAGNGTISATGLYTAPAAIPVPAQVSIMAVAQKNNTSSGSATVTVTAKSMPTTVTVVVTPLTVSVANFGTQAFSAAVAGSTNTAVTWQVNGVAGGSQKLGFISSTGNYVAPGAVPTASDGKGGTTTTTVAVTAVSQADTTASGTSTVTLVPANQNTQTAPIPLGASGSNANDSQTNATKGTITCCGGTLGALVTLGGTQYVLSNNHVLAMRDTASVGDAIVEPGLIDANCDKSQATTVANLTQFVNLENEDKTASSSNVDAAIAQVVTGEVDPTGNILYLGAAADANGVPLPGAPNAGTGIVATVNMAVAKSGRSTGLTCSTVLSVATNTSVEYNTKCDGTGKTFTVDYDNQVDVDGGSFSAEGDSGSLVVSQSTTDPVGLLYGGSDTDTVANPVSAVLNAFASGGNSVSFVGGTSHSVIGCSLPTASQSASKVVAQATMSGEVMQKPQATLTAQAPALLSHPEVQAVGVGSSYDNPTDPAIVFFVTAGQSHADIPAEVDGVRTRIVEAGLFPRRGAISPADALLNERSVAAPQVAYAVSDAEMNRAKTVHANHAKELMKEPGVQGVGITSSIDAPGEAALMIFLIRGVEHNAIPVVIDGLRTRVRESTRFKAVNRGGQNQRVCAVPRAKQPLEAARQH